LHYTLENLEKAFPVSTIHANLAKLLTFYYVPSLNLKESKTFEQLQTEIEKLKT